MKKIIPFILSGILIIPSGFVFAADYENEMAGKSSESKKIQGVPMGMEVLNVGSTRVLVPLGSKITRRDGLIILEGIDEYAARQLFAMKERIAELERNQEILANQIEELRQALKENSANALNSENKEEEKEQSPKQQ